jgi:hypothetical protein
VATVDALTKARAIYWDGSRVAYDKEGGEAKKTGTLSIGASTVFGGRFFNGGIEEAALWDRALAGDEVHNIHEATHNNAHTNGEPREHAARKNISS